MVKKALKTLDNNSGVRRSTRVKYHVQRLTYDGFVTHHYAYMTRVIQEVEPTCFEQAVGNFKWDNAMDEEMALVFQITRFCERNSCCTPENWKKKSPTPYVYYVLHSNFIMFGRIDK